MENEIRKVLLNIKNFRSAVRHFTLDELSDVQNKLGTIIDERKPKLRKKKKHWLSSKKNWKKLPQYLKPVD